MCSVCRWDSCFIRFLDGMLQTSALGTTDYQLRIPVRLRYVAILDAAPIIPVEGSGKPWAHMHGMQQVVPDVLPPKPELEQSNRSGPG